jgi:DNA helicase-2/ATP-dependent DNA helicase PcrA
MSLHDTSTPPLLPHPAEETLPMEESAESLNSSFTSPKLPDWLHARIDTPETLTQVRHSAVSPDLANVSPLIQNAQLNPEQLAVVAAPAEPTLVLAGAGSGKTHTLIHRVAHLVTQGLPPDQILLITFTRKASEEMIHRTQLLLQQHSLKIQGGTFHAMGLIWLKHYGGALGLPPKFSIMDEDDAQGLVHLLMSKLSFSRRKGFPKKHHILTLFSRAVNTLRSIADTVASDFPWLESHTPQLVVLFRAYTETKWRQHRVDYDDLLYLLYKLLCLHEPSRRRLGSHYQAILVDEYQDTTKLQSEIVRLLGSHHHNVMVVGDDAQSIYGFRGAHTTNMLEFTDAFPNVRLYKLEHNYRSTSPILSLANTVLQDAKDLYPKRLFTTNEGGSPPELIACYSEQAQSDLLTEHILHHQDEGIPLHRMAVLFRSSAHSNNLELTLARNKIAFVKYGGLQLTETAHFKDVLAYLRAADNPLDSNAWHRLLLLLDRVGPKLAERLIAAMQEAPHPLDVLDHVPGKAESTVRLLNNIIRTTQDESIPLADRLTFVIKHYEPILKRDYPEDAKVRIEDLKQLCDLAHQSTSLETFLEDLTLNPSTTSGNKHAHPDQHLVLSTIHSAKGLEWDVVFVIWVLDGQFPPVRSWHDDQALEEERRLLYVAVTRPRQRLVLTYPTEHYHNASQQNLQSLCRFLAKIPDDILPGFEMDQV